MEFAAESVTDLSTVTRSRNGHETAGNMKVVCIDNFKQLEIANKFDTSQISCMYFVNMALDCTHEEVSFV